MTQIFEDDGSSVAVTVVELLPLTVTQVKTQATDGYNAVQVGYVEGKVKHLTRARVRHLEKNGLPLFRHLKEFHVSSDDISTYTVGQQIDHSQVAAGVYVDVTGKSIGKGTQGGIRRWGLARGSMTHGSKSHRQPGSIGAGTTPGRVFKGLKMAGKMGNQFVTVQRLKVVKVLPELQTVLIKGALPGVEGSFVTICFRKS